MLHEGVRDQNPERRKVACECHDPDAGAVELRGQAIPTEHPDAEKGGFQEEGSQCLQCQGCAKDVPHEAGVFRPVHAEVELLHDAGHNAHSEVDEENRPKELHELL